MYKAIVYFEDLQDEAHPYNVGDTYPRKGLKPTDASLIGVITPYWFTLAWTIWHQNGDITTWLQHFTALGQLEAPFDYTVLTLQQLLLLAFLIVMFLLGSIHFVATS